MEIMSPSGKTYEIGKGLGETEHYRLYECTLENGRVCILKIAANEVDNGLLDREALVLQTLRDEAHSLEHEYARVAEDPNIKLNYQFAFPNLEETFVYTEQGNRRINILSFFEISEKLSDLVPIGHLASRDLVRIDPRTSAWILGKLLKLLTFTHSIGVEVGKLNEENIILNRDQHFVAVFDWSEAVINSGDRVSNSVATREISLVTREVVGALGGDPDTGMIPADDQLADSRYQDILVDLVRGGEISAHEAHKKFYKLIRSLWPSKFHPFGTYDLET